MGDGGVRRAGGALRGAPEHRQGGPRARRAHRCCRCWCTPRRSPRRRRRPRGPRGAAEPDPAVTDDVIPSPNIWNDPDVYEVENLGVDPDHLIEAAMRRRHDWSGQRRARRRLRQRLPPAAVRPRRGLAWSGSSRTPRWSSWPASASRRSACRDGRGPRAAPPRSCRWPTRRSTSPTPAGRTSSAPAASRAWPSWRGCCAPAAPPSSSTTTRPARPSAAGSGGPCRTTTRWRSSGSGPGRAGRASTIDTRWAFDSRADLRVGRADRVPARPVADGILAEHEGTGVDYAVNLWWRTFR